VNDDPRRVVLPLAAGTARCLACPWMPWPWLDLPADAQARQHTANTHHPTIYPSRQWKHSDRAASNHLRAQPEPETLPASSRRT
jgi:hypothetical protein